VAVGKKTFFYTTAGAGADVIKANFLVDLMHYIMVTTVTGDM